MNRLSTEEESNRVMMLSIALKDCLATYRGEHNIVTEERIEAWQRVFDEYARCDRPDEVSPLPMPETGKTKGGLAWICDRCGEKRAVRRKATFLFCNECAPEDAEQIK